ncbi:hypothetical protein CDAR_188801 [Caerostris darwini]|uniref:Uncharacterized protein n=1 Tax=Caerostris darwini TaxID=1538125 RepID=A0AAV4W0K2_9ARAC|nr:hypothetical protein CDAR_188801 [Caerostris darwini]
MEGCFLEFESHRFRKLNKKQVFFNRIRPSAIHLWRLDDCLRQVVKILMSVWDGFSIFFEADAPGVVRQLKSVLKEGQGSSRDVYFGLAFAGTLLFPNHCLRGHSNRTDLGEFVLVSC